MCNRVKGSEMDHGVKGPDISCGVKGREMGRDWYWSGYFYGLMGLADAMRVLCFFVLLLFSLLVSWNIWPRKSSSGLKSQCVKYCEVLRDRVIQCMSVPKWRPQMSFVCVIGFTFQDKL